MIIIFWFTPYIFRSTPGEFYSLYFPSHFSGSSEKIETIYIYIYIRFVRKVSLPVCF
jgi:hypothetical protein